MRPVIVFEPTHLRSEGTTLHRVACPPGRRDEPCADDAPRGADGTVAPVKAIRRFTVRTVLPAALAPLGELALNLRWSWHVGSQELFRSLDPVAMGRGRARPGAPARARWAPTGSRRSPRTATSYAASRRRRTTCTPTSPRTAGTSTSSATPRCRRRCRDDAVPRTIAYFSPEFGITAVLPQYSGGLGILAGDHLKAASDLGVPIVGVGLLYRAGYFAQSLSREGWQQERYPVLDPNGLPISLLREPTDNEPLKVRVGLPGGRHLVAQVWKAQVGRVPLLLLDSDVEDNEPAERDVTDRLYGGGSEHRLLQEMLLGIGGVRALRAYAALTGSPVARGVPHQRGSCRLPRHRADPRAHRGGRAHVRRGHRGGACRHLVHDPHAGGRRHRPVLPRPDRAALRRRQRAARACRSSASSRSAPRTTRAATAACSTWRSWVCGSPSAPTASPGCTVRSRGACSPSCGRVSTARDPDQPRHQRRARADLGGARGVRPRRDRGRPDARPGRHWLGRHRCTSATRRSGTSVACCASGSSSTCGGGCASPGGSGGRATPSCGWVDKVLDPDVLTIGFARRVPSYKRLTLMLRDPERLTRILLDPERPVQLVVAGKAHPADDGGKKLIQELVRFTDDPDGAQPHRVPAQLRHRHGPGALPRLRRVAEQPAAPARGVRHVGHEVGAQRRAQPVGPRRLVGRDVRRPQRLGDPHRRRRHRPRPPRRPRGRRALRPHREHGGAVVLRPVGDRPAGPLDRDGATHAADARAAGAGQPHGARLRAGALLARLPVRARPQRVLRRPDLRRRPRAGGLEDRGYARPGPACGSTTSRPPASATCPRSAAPSSCAPSSRSAT